MAGLVVGGLLGAGCRDRASSEYVADEFADAYFRRMDQDAALKFTALGATEMLDREIKDTRSVRESGYGAAEAASSVTFSRGSAVHRDARVGFHYTITVRADDSAPTQREADLELAQIGGSWKVVNVRIAR
jgi:hypothetical protein